MRSSNRFALVFCFALFASSALAAASETPFAGLELLGVTEIPSGSTFAGRPVGGLSGLAWSEREGLFLAISDDRSQRAPARLYRLRLDLADGRLDAGDLAVVDDLTLTDRDGQPFAPRSLDPEGIAVAGDRLFLSSEGDATAGVAPFVAELDAGGRVRRYLALPRAYLPARDAEGPRGVRRNLGFESLAVSPDGRYLFAASENALAQDGPESDVGVAGRARILRWTLAGDEPPREWPYLVAPVSVAPAAGSDGFRVRGLSDLLPLSDERLIALERQWVAGVGHVVELYRVDLAAASDVTGGDRLGVGAVPATKQAFLDFAALGVPLQNLEATAFGPRLPDGRRVLLVLADDNFDPAQRTQAIAFAVDEATPAIGAVQGAAHRSPLAGRWVLDLAGEVTATVDTRSQRGFWIESTRPDAEPATADGIFCAWDGAAPQVGERVRVHGRVVEAAVNERQLPVTQVAVASFARGADAAHATALAPPPRLVVDRPVPPQVDDDELARFEPAQDAIDFWESFEGMRVRIPPATVVGPTLDYGELVLLPDGAEAIRTAAGGTRVGSDGPARGRVIVSGRIAGLDDLDVGTRVGAVDGVVHYDFGNYKVIATAPLEVTAPAAPCAEATALAAAPGRLTLASFNVENLSVAGPPERIAALGAAIVERFGSPAVLALLEVQDDSGPEDDEVVSSARTLAAIVESVRRHGGPAYEAVWIDPERNREGGQPGGNIRVALLVDPAAATVRRRGDAGALTAAEVRSTAAGVSLSASPGRVAPTSAAFVMPSGEGVRRSLAVELEVDGQPLFVVVNHWSSKYDDDRAMGARQPPRRPTGAKRRAQAEAVRGWVEEILAADPAARVAVVGDLNESDAAPAVGWFSRAPLVNLVARVPNADRYTYNFEGGSEAIDHIVVSPALAERAEVDIVHLDTDCAESKRISDHDAVVVRFRLD